MTATPEQPVAAVDPVAAPPPIAAPIAPVAQVPVQIDPVIAERNRAAGIQAAARPEFQALATLALQEGWSVEVFTRAQDASAKAVTTATTAVRSQAFQSSMPAPVPHGGAEQSAMTPEERAEADWTQKPELRAEFGNKEAFLAFRRAEAAGKVRILSQQRRQAG